MSNNITEKASPERVVAHSDSRSREEEDISKSMISGLAPSGFVAAPSAEDTDGAVLATSSHELMTSGGPLLQAAPTTDQPCVQSQAQAYHAIRIESEDDEDDDDSANSA